MALQPRPLSSRATPSRSSPRRKYQQFVDEQEGYFDTENANPNLSRAVRRKRLKSGGMASSPAHQAMTPASKPRRPSTRTRTERSRPGSARRGRNVFKVLVMGNSKCGKTSIIKRYTENQFDTKYNITIGADYSKKVVSHEGELVRLQLWDIAGQDRFVHLTRPFYQKAKAAAIVCDVTRPVTLNAVRAWKKDLDEKMGEGTLPVVVIANKCDLLKGIPEAMKLGAQIESLCSELKVNKWFIASAKIDENVDNAMAYLVSELMQNPDKADNDDQRLESSGSIIKLGSLADNHNYNNQPTNYGACCYGAG